MSSSIKNLASVLIFATVAFAGYYFFVQKDSGSEDPLQSDAEYQATLAKTSEFIGHSQELDRMMLDTSLLEDQRFRSLRSYSTPVRDVPIGRPDPFASVFGNAGVE